MPLALARNGRGADRASVRRPNHTEYLFISEYLLDEPHHWGATMKQARVILEQALEGLDQLGYRLEELGITDKVNRHNCLALLFNEQKRLQGELDRLNVRISTRKAQLLRIRRDVTQLVNQGLNTVTAPAKFALGRLQNLAS